MLTMEEAGLVPLSSGELKMALEVLFVDEASQEYAIQLILDHVVSTKFPGIDQLILKAHASTDPVQQANGSFIWTMVSATEVIPESGETRTIALLYDCYRTGTQVGYALVDETAGPKLRIWSDPVMARLSPPMNLASKNWRKVSKSQSLKIS